MNPCCQISSQLKTHLVLCDSQELGLIPISRLCVCEAIAYAHERMAAMIAAIPESIHG